MTRLLDEFQTLICSATPDFGSFAMRIREEQNGLKGTDLARSHVVTRLARAWQDLDRGETGTADLAVLLRQAIRSHARRITVPRTLWERIATRDERAGLWSADGEFAGWVDLHADDWTPNWLSNANAIDRLETRRHDESAIGNGTLQAMMGTEVYTSAAQKAAVEACLFASPGSTTLVTLPTGAGKSLCALLPAWRESAGGRIASGSTLVVVPTVSLALDQQEQAAQRFSSALDEASSPQAWTGQTDPELRASIRRGLLVGTLPILYTSPEALMAPNLFTTCLEAAGRGHITRLVVDEAHIVETWGAGFRTEFQFLATFRRKLWEASNGQLRTLLLSATVTASCEDLLTDLFVGPGGFVNVRANRLRPEPSYWFAQFPEDETRCTGVLEALHYLPRPAILYVTKPETAVAWVTRLTAAGFRRVRAYTGLTRNDDRQRILQRWRAGDIDLIVANSAFGLGVDKGDVRAIIHACLPENIDRFYQEVGRGGRDGNATISLLCTTEQDKDLAYFMGAGQVISTGKAVSRWQGMRRESGLVSGHGDLLLVDTNAPPRHDPGMQPSDLNREWNEHTLLLLQRARLIEVTTTRISTAESQTDVEAPERLQVRLLCPDTLADPEPELLEAAIGNVRERERRRINGEIGRMARLAAYYADPVPTHCIAEELALLYPDCARACGGCPACRARGRPPYAAPLEFFVEGVTQVSSSGELAPRLAERLTGGPLNLYWTDADWLTNPRGLPTLLAELIAMGVTQLIVPEELLERPDWSTGFVGQLTRHARLLHLIMPAAWIETRPDIPLHRCPTVVVYPHEPAAADRFHTQFCERRGRELAGVALIQVAQPALHLASEHGSFRDRINGTPENARSFQDWATADDLDSF